MYSNSEMDILKRQFTAVLSKNLYAQQGGELADIIKTISEELADILFLFDVTKQSGLVPNIPVNYKASDK